MLVVALAGASGGGRQARGQSLLAQAAPSVRRPAAVASTAIPDSVRSALADTAGEAMPREPSGPWYKQPKWIMLRSVVVPGWGQWTNGKHVKALVVAAGEGYLLYRAVDWGRREREAPTTSDHDYASSKRRDFTWWSIFAGALSMGDAYVDAQLGRHFSAEFKPQDQSSFAPREGFAPGCTAWNARSGGRFSGAPASGPGTGPAGLRLSLRFTFP